MAARKSIDPEPGTAAIQLSLRIRHPSIDPNEITDALGLSPEHSFRAGTARTSRAGAAPAGQHTQSYWLARLNGEARSAEGLMLRVLQRLSLRQAFLQMVQAGGGDAALLIVIPRDANADFTLSVAVAKLLVQLGISAEFTFDA